LIFYVELDAHLDVWRILQRQRDIRRGCRRQSYAAGNCRNPMTTTIDAVVIGRAVGLACARPLQCAASNFDLERTPASARISSATAR